MPDRIPSDHASVHTERAEVARSGGTRRPCLRLPAVLHLDAGAFVRLVIDGETHHAEIQGESSGLLLRGAYDLKSEARDPGRAENRLVEWLREQDCKPGEPVEIDEIDAGERYGVRLPGERAVYRDGRGPGRSLQGIAETLDGDSEDTFDLD